MKNGTTPPQTTLFLTVPSSLSVTILYFSRNLHISNLKVGTYARCTVIHNNYFDFFSVFTMDLKEGNPWDVVSMFDFVYFCCPECDIRTQSKQEFVSHASTDHPWVSFFIDI